jgi:hypothetical protein
MTHYFLQVKTLYSREWSKNAVPCDYREFHLLPHLQFILKACMVVPIIMTPRIPWPVLKTLDSVKNPLDMDLFGEYSVRSKKCFRI